jgi:3',5'-cyclic-AMP phosphodiesterase
MERPQNRRLFVLYRRRPELAMSCVPGTPSWQCGCEAPEGKFSLTVRTTDSIGNSGTETIRMAAGSSRVSQRNADGSDAYAVGAWPEKHILGTQLGPNRNGRKW